MTGPSKASGNANSTAGGIKETIGRVFGSTNTEAEGAAQKHQGNAEVGAAKTQGYTEGAADSFTGNIKKNVGSALGNESMHAHGAATETKGDVKKAANNY
ncbi:hypothetical protein HK104_009315 [Borealophlyctis nickersoniae]|nr:hypothetical protein HK104_009315 [Borealophlyctis nickersoniae]